MFLSKLPDELPANRRMARELVQRWSRPIFEAYRNDRCHLAIFTCPQSYTTKGTTGTKSSNRRMPTDKPLHLDITPAGADAEHRWNTAGVLRLSSGTILWSKVR